ncbi:MAG: protein ImuB [Streptosporangiaceae bacterium]|nr:protein ImuB [Streptosporangiaceae bacterium]
MTGAVDGRPSRVLVVWCPDWPVVAAGDDATAPVAALAAGRVVACSASARDAGVRRGQRIRDAQHHCPALIAMPRDEAREARVFEQVLAVVEEFCPRLEVTRPGLCALGARGPARYFGGEESLVGKLAAAVAESGFACRIGIADGLFAGELAARAGPAGVIVAPSGTRRFLAEQPVTALGSADLADLLARLGIRTLGEFAALPAADAADRFGTAGSVAHRLARGLEPRPLATRASPAALSLAIEFDPPAPQAEPVIFAAKALAEQMHAGLRDRGLACVRVEVAVTGSDGRQSTRLWRHEGLLSALAVAERVRWQLDGWRVGGNGGGGNGGGDGNGGDGNGGDGSSGGKSAGRGSGDATEAGGITMLRLIPDQLVPDHGRQLGLWGEAQAGDQVSRAAMRVQAMLGHEAVTHPVISGGRGPADQVTLVPFGDARPPRLPADRPWPGSIPVPAPATVYPDPLPARVTDASGGTVTVTGRACVSAVPAWLAAGAAPPLSVIAWAGPWPVSERWWEPGQARRRARFQMVTSDESAWLVTVQDGHWFVEASYD